MSEQEQQKQRSAFNPNEHILHLKSKEGMKDYLPVQWRIVWFRSLCPQGSIKTHAEEVDPDREVTIETDVWNAEKRRSEKTMKTAKGYARFFAIVEDGKGGVATGTKTESAVSFPDYVEKAETGAVGRALAMLGYGTQFTGEEFDEGQRLADSPLMGDTSSSSSSSQSAPSHSATTTHANAAAQNPAKAAGTAKPTKPVVNPVPTQPTTAPAQAQVTETTKAEPAVDSAAKTVAKADPQVVSQIWTRLNTHMPAIPAAHVKAFLKESYGVESVDALSRTQAMEFNELLPKAFLYYRLAVEGQADPDFALLNTPEFPLGGSLLNLLRARTNGVPMSQAELEQRKTLMVAYRFKLAALIAQKESYERMSEQGKSVYDRVYAEMLKAQEQAA